MTFDFDPAKSVVNKRKHGIDFLEAQQLRSGRTVEIPATNASEERWLVMGKIGAKSWTAIITRRGFGTRIISVRRSRKSEEDIYETI